MKKEINEIYEFDGEVLNWASRIMRASYFADPVRIIEICKKLKFVVEGNLVLEGVICVLEENKEQGKRIVLLSHSESGKVVGFYKTNINGVNVAYHNEAALDTSFSVVLFQAFFEEYRTRELLKQRS